uniref:Genome polyprotein n=1 Tax=Beet mosaic virus TaxID=114921 RepID=A0A8G1LTX3_BTMV|nr:polyprotein [Beet mosaic virus]
MMMHFGEFPSDIKLPAALCCNMTRTPLITRGMMASTVKPTESSSVARPIVYSAVATDGYTKAQQAFEESFREKYSGKLEAMKYGKVVKKSGLTFVKRAGPQAIAKGRELDAALEKFNAAFEAGEFEDVTLDGDITTGISVSRGESVWLRSVFWSRTLKKQVRRKTPKLVTKADFDDLFNKVLKVASSRHIPVEIIGKKAKKTLKFGYKRVEASTIPYFHLPHHNSNYIQRELHPQRVRWLVPLLVRHRKIRDQFNDSMITRGWSGLVLPKTIASTCWRRYEEVIVRGRLYGKVEDARTKLPKGDVGRTMHYSSGEERFFAGWKEGFDKLVPAQKEHVCKIVQDNKFCGRLAASIVQIAFPCHKMACDICRGKFNEMTPEAYSELIDRHLDQRMHEINEAVMQFPGLKQVVSNFRSKHTVNTNMSDILEITKLTQGHKANQMMQLSRINSILIKGNTATPEEMGEASGLLLELTRWFKNHLSVVDKGSLRAFRNKRSNKALVNPSLLCDNQRDKNGNFIWGERGYHSKRFFASYFDEVTPGDGYKDYIIRKGPQGVRKLAIGNLIVSFDLEKTREALKGEETFKLPLSDACVSKRNGNYVYTSCCVTLDDGTPLFSNIKNPTKRHLIVGTTGDPKIVDLPAADTDKMYIAKEGYCYLNIFLAMLINVNENEAKAFTKMVRDVIVPMLGIWPTMQDLATACFIMTAFYPETSSAELPRILVDHLDQTMHVIDSFGSLTTGFHVLKAGTAAQLIDFASADLTGEMKLYRVGGHGLPVKEKMVCALIESIYRPKKMVYLIQEDPYILVMALCSPKLIISLFNNGALELAMKHWISRDKSLSLIFSMLSDLAGEMSKAELLVDQHRMINECAKRIHDTQNYLDDVGPHQTEVRSYAALISDELEADKELHATGFATFSERLHSMTEKMYGDKLEEEWQGLGLLEKFSFATFVYKHKPHGTPVLPPRKTEDSDGRYVISPTWFVGQMKGHLNGSRRYATGQVTRFATYLRRKTLDKAMYIVGRCLKDLVYLVNVALVAQLLISMITTVYNMVNESRVAKKRLYILEMQKANTVMYNLYDTWKMVNGRDPTYAEFKDYVSDMNPGLVKYLPPEKEKPEVEYQANKVFEQKLTKAVALMALFTMIFDTEKSGAVFTILRNIKSVFSTLGEEVKYQSLDEIQSIDDEKKLTIDFDLDTENHAEHTTMDVQFEKWWDKQLSQNRVVPHYRIGGTFVEFTRHTAASVCNTICTSSEQEFVVRGAVGSGKSTGLPSHLSRKGRVLLIEPTRPLAENVCKQLRKEPFHLSPTLKMRGLVTFGSSNISVMTSGYALHFHANNPHKLEEFDFIMIDESHTMDSSTMAFYCLLREYEFKGKILKVSATPPGRECEFKTQHDVLIKIEDSLSYNSFVTAQGTGSNADVVQNGDNILVYVPSYNDVDQLSKGLMEKGFLVTKVDGRTMKMGNVEIPTKGSPSKKHFIVATNIIENGVTLDIDVVVDFGLKVMAELDSDSRCMRYKKVSISFGERLQRLGRVGRVKQGTALRIGHTETGMTEIPMSIATEAAFICFAYNLPVMTHNVTASLLSRCTNRQARTMMQYELSPFFTVELVHFNGSVHPQIEKKLRGYKLRDSEIQLSTLAIPNSGISRWKTVQEYKKMGVRIEADDQVRIPFAANGIPDKLYSELWDIIKQHKSDAGFGRLTSACASKVSYTLTTQPHAIPRTLAIIEHLLREEQQKKAYFESLNDTLCTASFSLAGMVDNIRRRYLKDHSAHNIEVLQNAKSQLNEFNSKAIDPERVGDLLSYGLLDTVQYQSATGLQKRLKLKGRWNGSLAVKDIVIAGAVFAGGCWMLWEYAKSGTEVVQYQGKGKRMMQKLKFRQARDNKIGREVYGDDGTIEHYFGAAYTEKGKKRGNNSTKGMGKKTRRFVHMYGFDPTEYSFVRFVDPLTGYSIDESVQVDISLVQDEIGDHRRACMETDDDLIDYIKQNPAIQAYYMKHGSDKALRVDLSPHNPLRSCEKTATIAGFPEREDELRQTGAAQVISAKTVPGSKDVEVREEGKSIVKGLRNYNPISSVVCRLTNDSAGNAQTLYGIGYGPLIITNSHLFKANNGTLLVRSHQGEFTVQNTTQLQVHHVKDKDMILIRMPKDFPPFPMRLKFREPKNEERACLVGSRFQQKSLSSEVSDSTLVRTTGGSGYWKHWVSTKEGDCGLPMVSLVDGSILGLHGLTSVRTDINYFVPFTDDFQAKYLSNIESLDWVRHWRHTPDKVAWNGMTLRENGPAQEFSVSKLIADLTHGYFDEVVEQGYSPKWVANRLDGNLKAVASSSSQLVTKHIVKGPCVLFQEFLATHEEAAKYFVPRMGEYGPSRLNKEAFLKDFLKYAGPITVGVVNTNSFEDAVASVICMLEDLDFGECAYVTDPDAIFDSLNMKAAVGALYQGKKKEYFERLTSEEQESLLRLSCERLYKGQMGIWNGSLKAELRPKEKLEQNKTRTFTAAPIDTLLGGKVCVDDFNNRFYSLNLQGPWSVGMTKFYGGWNELLQKFPDGWIYCDADGSQFDSSLTPYLINAVVQIREHFMEDWEIGQQMLRNFYTEIVYTPILTPDGTIVKKFKGNNSGQPSTVVDNTLMVILAMHYAMHQQCWKKEEMKEKIRFFANGDDLLIAIHPEKEKFLNVLSEYFHELGLKYDFSSRHTRRENLWFMSHRGLYLDDMYIPKLEEERIVSILEWDRSNEATHRAEAICAAMIEAWGYPELLRHIREFYLWMMEHAYYKDLVREGKLPYIAETALAKLYTDKSVNEGELVKYWKALGQDDSEEPDEVCYQGDEKPSKSAQQPPPSVMIPHQVDAGASSQSKDKQSVIKHDNTKTKDVGQASTVVPRLKQISKMRMPVSKGRQVLALDHLLDYKPEQVDLSNTRATREQFDNWYEAVMKEYDVSDSQIGVIMNGLMVWCIENGTSPNLTGDWVMMDGEEQVAFPLKPIVENAKPSFRQIMHHFSDAAEAYIEMRNRERPYMPRYGAQRNLRDKTLARYAFDFYEITSRTTDRAREAHFQMKAAALAHVSNKLFGLDGNVATTSEDTERHTATDVNAKMHTLMGVHHG